MEVLTGNELLSGATVYLDGSGRWGGDLQQARLFGPDEAASRDAAIAATAATGRICSLEVEAVELRDGAIYPIRIRERIRAEGPTAPRFAPQGLSEGDHVSI